MSAPLDVRAVMDDLTDLALNSGGRRGEEEIPNEPAIKLFDNAVEASAAVAELIEKGRKIDAGWEVGTSGGYIGILADDLSAFRAALARVQGGAE